MFGYFLCPIMQTAFLLGRSRCVGVGRGGGEGYLLANHPHREVISIMIFTHLVNSDLP